MQLKVNGTTLFYETVGDGPPCLCLHGGPGTDSSGLRRTLAPLADALGLQLILYDHRGHGRSEWVAVEQCTQDQLVADAEGVRQGLGLGRVHVLGISWGGFLGLMYAARHPGSVVTLAVVGAAASSEFMPRAEANARAQSTPEQWTAYRALWDGSLADDAAFEKAFATIRPLYFFDQSLAAASLQARADTRHRLAVRRFIIEHELPTLRLSPGAGAHRGANPDRGRPPRLDLPGGSGGGDPPPRGPLEAGDLRAQRPLAPGRGARGVHAAPGRYFPVQRTALSDWYTPAKVGIGTKPS